MKKLICIVGPTATGKTALALQAAQKFSGSLINVDSRQVFKKLDIISGKDIPSGSQFHPTDLLPNSPYSIGYYDIQNIPLYSTDVVEPTYEFSVNDFIKVVPAILNLLETQEKLPILVGGTGFYVKSLLDGVDTVSVPPDEELRRELENKSVEELQNQLKDSDIDRFEQMNNSDKNNSRRLIRAIEILRHGEVEPEYHHQKIASREVQPLSTKYEIWMIGLTASRETLQSRIDQRVQSRLEQGALKEAESLFKNYDSLSNNVKTSSGYQQLFEYLKGDISLGEAIEKWKKAEYLIAKKQMTWFKKDERVVWFDIEQKGYETKIFNQISNFLASK